MDTAQPALTLQVARQFIADERESFIQANTTSGADGEPDHSTLDQDARAVLASDFDPPLAAADAALALLTKLQDEVHYWRQNTALMLNSALHDAASPERATVNANSHTPGARVRRFGDLLRDALTGELHDTCEACGEAVRPGDAIIMDVECGEMHADCCGDSADGGPIKPGDKVMMEPDAIHWEGEGPKPDHIIAGIASPLFTDEQIVALVAKAGVA